ncbi:30S ribosomal protein S20 [Candidatus Falkowbacteria bacterium RIFOXYC2_FULL_47_12]|uniref:Small ribosomal subunit protein bS20 n=2 Tax=Candidatus Falkowiibacteriota TaxID=1752728 RepID=A0A1F5TNC9_9BACT|nr:MAG: 30S ribosomal protein S20 [Candidatus Falkowbacteria bacterium RIFOXYA2_FULL_47_9]OGF40420.1 MAG: 30S ribosomal protein S20 [Candidatus Falkowbacteria bacterium RIFOXYC2_FULL_47_12]
MPNIKAAAKALRQSKKLQVRNAAVKNNIKSLVKKSTKAIQTKSETAAALVKQLAKAVDKAVQKGVLKKNTGRRRQSRIMKKFNAAFGVTKK